MKWAGWLPLIGVALLVAGCGQQLDEGLLELNNSVRADNVIPGQYIIVLKDDVDVGPAARALARAHGLGVLHTYTAALRGFAATVPPGRLAALAQDARVLSIEPDRVVAIAAPTPGKGKEGGAPQPPQVTPTGVQRINAAGQNDLSNAAIRVAIIDTGIDLEHPDLNVDVGNSRNFSTGKSADDGNGHGTHVAGTVGAIDNPIGVVGVAPGVTLLAVRVLNNAGSGTFSSVIAGVDYVTASAQNLNIKVANMSLGGSGSDTGGCSGDALHQAICNSVEAGVTYAVAAGNSEDDAANHVPAAYDEVITVSAIADSDGACGGSGAPTPYGDDDTFASFSNFGEDVDLAAPGVSILSTWKEGGYNTISGTSMATPHVAGAAVLYILDHPEATPEEVRLGLINSGIAQGDNCGFSGDPDGFSEPLVYAGTP